jgi:hypothetical protein
MKKTLAIMLCFICIIQRIGAQEIPKLNVPSTPAFSILDFEPSAIMRPTTAKSLATDVLNSFDKNGKLLMNLGLEVSPYWLKSHPDLTRHDYLHPKLGQALKQSFSLSAATVKDSATGNHKLGAGFKFRFSDGRPTDELEATEKELVAKANIINAINTARAFLDSSSTRSSAIDDIVNNLKQMNTDDQVIASVKKKAEILAKNFTDSRNDIDKFIQKLIEDRQSEKTEIELRQKVSDLTYDRKGFMFEFAGATGYDSNDEKLERLGVWGNASYFVSPNDFFTLTARYMHQNKDTSLSNIDVGLGFIKKNTNYNISIEGMFRWYRAEIPDINSVGQPINRLEKNFTYRLAVQGSYMISKDISINVSIGKEFDSPLISRSGVFSILGLNYSLFSKEPLALK